MDNTVSKFWKVQTIKGKPNAIIPEEGDIQRLISKNMPLNQVVYETFINGDWWRHREDGPAVTYYTDSSLSVATSEWYFLNDTHIPADQFASALAVFKAKQITDLF